MDVFSIKDDELLETSNNICSKVSNIVKKELDCKLIYNKKISGNQDKALRLRGYTISE